MNLDTEKTQSPCSSLSEHNWKMDCRVRQLEGAGPAALDEKREKGMV